MQLDGKIALVTGGGTGVGQAIAKSFAQAGAQVVITGRRQDKLEQTCAAIQAAKPVRYFVADVADRTQVASLIAWINEEFGALDIVVNNAAISRDGFVMLTSPATWDEVVAVNLRGPFLCARAALRPMIRRRWGRIVNIVSPAALLGQEGAAAYAATKGGLLSFTRSLAREVGRYGITVNALCPGLVETRLIADMPAAVRERHLQTIPLGRFGAPDEIAHAVRFLASPAASYVSGALLAVDGGLTMT